MIITLNVSRLNAPTKRHRLVEWIKKNKTYICYLQDTHSDLGTHTESEGMRKGIQCKWKSKESCSSNIHIKKETLKYRWLEDTKDAT